MTKENIGLKVALLVTANMRRGEGVRGERRNFLKVKPSYFNFLFWLLKLIK